MTYVIANLEDHTSVVSPKLLRLDEHLIEGLF
jgi:hypothetical protein